VATFAALKGVAMTDAFVTEVLGAHSKPLPKVNVTIDAIQKTVAAHFSVRVADLKGPRRHRGVSRPRMIAMFLCRELTGSSFPEIGMRFGGKDHSTVINACKRMAAFEAEDPDVKATLGSLRHQLRGALGDGA
jgi:chromosomal replication initiator protein